MHHKERGQSRGPGHRGPHHGGRGGCGGKGPCGPHNGGRGGFFGHGSTPVLTYFDGEGLAEQIRLTFTVGGVHFIDRRIKDHAEFDAKLKAYAPHGQLPILEVDGEILCQSGAILMYAARKANLEPEAPLDRDRARSLQSILIELFSVGEAVPSSMPAAERRERMFAAMGTKLPVLCDRIESIITPSANGWLFGDSISYADIAIHCAMRSWRLYMPNGAEGLEEKYPKMASVDRAVDAHPAIIRYRAEKAPFKPKLYYFDADGLAAPIRWAFEIGGIDYEDVRFTHADWPEIKPKMPAGTVPALEIAEGEFLTESLAILVHAARKAGLLPWKESQFAHAYSVGLTLAAVSPVLRTIYTAENEEAKAKALEIAQNETLPAILKRLENIVGMKQSKQGYVVGDRLTFADLLVANTINMLGARMMGLVIPELWAAYPNLVKVYKLVVNHPVVARYLVNSPKVAPKFYYFDIAARGEAVRQIFKYADVEFEDIRLSRQDWIDTYKPSALTGKCPFIDVGTDRIYETLGCVLYAAERADLIPRTWKARAQAMSLVSVLNGTIKIREGAYVHPEGAERTAYVDDKRADLEAQYSVLEKVLGASQSVEGYAVGGELSWVDFYLAYETDFCAGPINWLTEGWQEKFPAVAKIHKLVTDLRK